MSTFAADDVGAIAKRQAEIAAQEERDRLEAERRAAGWRSGDGHRLIRPPIGKPPAWLQAEIDADARVIDDPAEAQKTVDREEKVESWYETVYATQSPAPVEPSGVRSLFDRAFISARREP